MYTRVSKFISWVDNVLAGKGTSTGGGGGSTGGGSSGGGSGGGGSGGSGGLYIILIHTYNEPFYSNNNGSKFT